MATAVRPMSISFRPVGLQGSKTQREAAAQSFVKGELLKFVSGKLTAVTHQADERVCGIAKQNATGVTDTELEYEVITPDTRLRVPVYDSTPAQAVTSRANIGAVAQMTTVSHKSTLDNDLIGASANAIFFIDDIEGDVGEQYGYYIVGIKLDNLFNGSY